VSLTAEHQRKRWRETQAYRVRHPDRVAAKHFASNLGRYGLTLAGYNELLDRQGGGCAICATPEPGGRGRFHVDHDHKTGIVRGLLCHACNVGIGNLGDDPERLRAAADYLERG
jgi:hypothetical protein